MVSGATTRYSRIIAKAVVLTISMLASPLLFLIVDALLLLLIQEALGLEPFPLVWPGGPIWPAHIAIPAYLVAALCGAAAVHLLIARLIRSVTNWDSLAVVACTYLFLFPYGLFGVFQTVFPSVGTFSVDDVAYLLVFLVLVFAPYLSLRGMRAAQSDTRPRPDSMA